MTTKAPPSYESTDEHLVDGSDFYALYDRYSHRLMVFIQNQGVSSSDLEDVLQETWIRVCRNLEKARQHPKFHFRGWLFEIARNLAADWRKKKRPEQLSDSKDMEAPPMDALCDMVQDERTVKLQKCVSKLSEEQRTVVQGRLAGESNTEIGDRLGVTAQIVSQRYHRAIANLERCMKGWTSE
jgi:RNA polymerase sigma factor (sigma-70 family)